MSKSALSVALVGVLLAACGDAGPSAGETAYTANCASCHATKAVGSLGPNITFSTTAGIGSWSQADFTKSVRTGVNKDGRTLCEQMTRYSTTALSDDKLNAIYAYLSTLKNDTANKGSYCP